MFYLQNENPHSRLSAYIHTTTRTLICLKKKTNEKSPNHDHKLKKLLKTIRLVSVL